MGSVQIRIYTDFGASQDKSFYADFPNYTIWRTFQIVIFAIKRLSIAVKVSLSFLFFLYE